MCFVEVDERVEETRHGVTTEKDRNLCKRERERESFSQTGRKLKIGSRMEGLRRLTWKVES